MVMTPEERREAWRKAAAARRRQRLESCDAVPLAPFQQRYLLLERRGEITMYELCVRMDWMRRPSAARSSTVPHPDTSRGQRVLGFRRDVRKANRCEPALRVVVSLETGMRLADALGMDPHEAGV